MAMVRVAILTRSEDRVQLSPERTSVATAVKLRSSPGPKTGCSSVIEFEAFAAYMRVAILTRSEDRVQLCRFSRSATAALDVAILTRSEDRVQPGRVV